MEIKISFRFIGIVIIIATVLLFSGIWIGYNRCNRSWTERYAAIDLENRQLNGAIRDISETITGGFDESLQGIDLIEEYIRRTEAREFRNQEANDRAQEYYQEAERRLSGIAESTGTAREIIRELSAAVEDMQRAIAEYKKLE